MRNTTSRMNKKSLCSKSSIEGKLIRLIRSRRMITRSRRRSPPFYLSQGWGQHHPSPALQLDVPHPCCYPKQGNLQQE